MLMLTGPPVRSVDIADQIVTQSLPCLPFLPEDDKNLSIIESDDSAILIELQIYNLPLSKAVIRHVHNNLKPHNYPVTENSEPR